jgi:hypothetical protein
MMRKGLAIFTLLILIAVSARASITDLPTVGPSGATGPSGPTGPTGMTGATGAICPHVGTPSLAAGTSSGQCGTSPGIIGSDCAGTITIGTNYLNSCTMTFAQSFTNAPTCIAYDYTAPASEPVNHQPGTATWLLDATGAGYSPGDVVGYICLTYP